MDSVRLKNGCKLIWTKKNGLDGIYIDTVISLLNNEKTVNTIQIQSSNNSKAWKAVVSDELIFIKFFNIRGFRDRLFFRKSRACRAMEGSISLLEKGFLSPDLIAAGEVKKNLLMEESFLITKWLEGSRDVYGYFETIFKNPVSEKLQKKRSFIRTAGQLIGKLHKTGIFHGDLRAGNILITGGENRPLFYFIDNERTKYFHKGIPLRLREKNLVQVNMIIMPQITFTDRLRFFKAYLDENPELKPAAKDLIKKIFRKTKKRLQKNTVYSGKVMRKIKILHLVKRYDGNHALRNAMILGLDQKKYKAKICFLSGKPDGKSILDRHELSIYLDIDNLSNHKIKTSIMLKNLISAERPDILHCHRHAATVFGVLAGLTEKIRIISHVHGLDRTRSLKRRFTNWLIFKRVDKIITVSDSVRHDVIKTNWNIEPSKVVTVKNCLELKIIDNIKISKTDARLKLGVPEGEVVFGTVGRLVPTKGQSYLIDAFSRVQKKIPNSRLVIVGEGLLFNKLAKQTDELGISSRVLFTGYREDVLELIRGLDVFVLPSLAEGLSIALLEAMASRLPVIASNVGGIPEVFGNSRCGRLVTSRDVDSLFAAMLEIGNLAGDKKKALGEEGRNRIEKEFTSDVMLKHIEEVYKSVLNKSDGVTH